MDATMQSPITIIVNSIRGQNIAFATQKDAPLTSIYDTLYERAPWIQNSSYILTTEMLPNLVAPILVYSTLLIPTNILFEAALSFLGVGIRPPTPSWGGMLSDAVAYYTQPHFMLWPGLAIFVTVLAFNLFGDGLRDALDPRKTT